MTHQSGVTQYFRRSAAAIDVGLASRLPAVRVRTFELRLIALVLAGCWAVAAGLVLVAYRPGGPIDVAVGIAALLPAVIALGGVAWPPVARGDRAFSAMVWLAAGSLLVLVPSIADVAGQIGARGAQTLLPSVEAAYPWVLALIGTCLFTGFGIARRRLGEEAMRRRRLVRGITMAPVIAVGTALVFSAVAMANELALRDRVAVSSRFGPTDATREPPECDGPMGIGPAARVVVHLDGTLDGRSLGTIDLAGERSAGDVRWLAYAATNIDLGLHGATTIGSTSWARDPGSGWRLGTDSDIPDPSLDLAAFRTALTPAARKAASTLGVSLVEGARARQCRTAIDGPTFRTAFPQVAWLVGDADLAHWRGQLDYWVFIDGEIGQMTGSVNGDAADLREGALQATIRVDLTATDRDSSIRITPPSP